MATRTTAGPTTTAGALRAAGYVVPERFADEDVVEGLTDQELAHPKAPARKVKVTDPETGKERDEVRHVTLVERYESAHQTPEYLAMTPRERSLHDSKVQDSVDTGTPAPKAELPPRDADGNPLPPDVPPTLSHRQEVTPAVVKDSSSTAS